MNNSRSLTKQSSPPLGNGVTTLAGDGLRHELHCTEWTKEFSLVVQCLAV